VVRNARVERTCVSIAGFTRENTGMSTSIRFAPVAAVAAILLLLAAASVPARAGDPGEDGSTPPAASAGTAFLPGTAIDEALAPALQSAEPVAVIIVLKDQPLYRISSEVRAVYEPRAQAKAAQVRQILAKYAGKRNFASVEEMRAQARLEAASVTPADRAMKDLLNREADEILGQMRKETQRRVREEVEAGQSRVSAAVTSLGGRVAYGLLVQNAVAALVPGTAIAEISRHPLVSFVTLDREFSARLNVSRQAIGVNSFWTVGENGGAYDGAVCDTGVDTAHPDLDDDTAAARTWASHTFHATAQTRDVYNDNPASTDDLHGHGTHVAGIMFSSNATFRGVAFGADSGMNLKAAYYRTDGGASSAESDVRAALDWAQAQAEEPEVVNYSYGSETADDDDELSQFFDAFIESQYCTATIAAGNSGSGASTVESPSLAYNCLSVANMDDVDTATRTDDVIRGSSSRGPTDGGRRKPDITAPGTDIWSTNYQWESSGDFIEKSGTSMAAPQVAGAALLLNDVGVLDTRAVKAVLINTAEDRGDEGWDATFGWGYLDLARAYLHRSDVFMHSVAPRNQSGEYMLYKTTGMDADETATLTWYRHVVYNGADLPVTIHGLSDLNLRLYDEANGTSIDSDLTLLDNVHQVRSDRSGPQVIRVYAWSTSFAYGGATESYALATQEGTSLVAGPTVTPSSSDYTPPLGAKFTVTVRVQNTGDVAAHGCSVTLTLPAGVTLAEGSLTQSLGSIGAGSSGYAYFVLDTTSSGVKTVAISTSSSSYGVTFTGSASFTVTPGAQDLRDPYTTMKIGAPSYQSGGTNIITNGGFESGLTGWTTAGTAAITTAKPYDGSNSLLLGPGTGTAYQTVSISSSAAYATLTFWYKSSASLRASAGCRISDTSGNTLNVPLSKSSSVLAWSQVTIDVGRFRGETIRIYFYSSYSLFGDSSLTVDGVTLKQNEYIYVDDTAVMTLAARDENSGVDYSSYRRGSEAYATYAGGFMLAGLADGLQPVTYRSVDNGGNVEPEVVSRLYLDTRPPRTLMRISGASALSGGTQKAVNGGFESGLASWTASGSVSAESYPVHSGVGSAMVGETGPGELYQDIAVSPGASRAVLSAWIRTVQGTGSTYCRVQVVDVETGYSCDSFGMNSTTDWQQCVWDVSGFKGRAVRVQFGVVTSSGASATLFVDDVSLREGGSTYILPSTQLTLSSADLCGVQKYERSVDSAGYLNGSTFTIADPGTHSVLYRALDNLNHQETDASTQVVVDTAGPTGTCLINFGAAATTSLDVSLYLSANDPAGVTLMRIQSDTGVWGSWRPYMTGANFTFSSPAEGSKTVSVQFQDSLGNAGPVIGDSIFYQEPIVMDIPDAKMLPDGEGVRLESKIVTGVFPSSGYFYIEEKDRASGIRVRTSQSPGAVGDRVLVEGVTDTVYSEREITPTYLSWQGSGVPPEPLGVTNGTLGGAAFHYQPGALGAAGLNNTGLLVRTCGWVVEHTGLWFSIADGSALVNPGEAEPKLLVTGAELGGTLPPVRSFVIITGISGMETIYGNTWRILRPRSVADVQIVGID